LRGLKKAKEKNMRAKKLLAALAASLVILGGTALAMGNETCPVCDDNVCIWTGGVRHEYGHTFYQYRCPKGHLFWEREM